MLQAIDSNVCSYYHTSTNFCVLYSIFVVLDTNDMLNTIIIYILACNLESI